MATSYKKTNIAAYPRIGEKITRDTLYWKNLEFPVTQKEHGAVSSIHFSPKEPYNFAVTSTIKVQVFNSQSNEVYKTFSRFKENARSGCFRHDGKLLVAGGDEGVVRLFDVAGKALLRIFRGHVRPVHATRFTCDGLQVVSGSDDKTMRLWDIAVETEVSQFQEHQDYVRCLAPSPTSSNLILADVTTPEGDVASDAARVIPAETSIPVPAGPGETCLERPRVRAVALNRWSLFTGSYDHTVKMFDSRSPTSAMTLDHGQPVESVLVYPSGGLLISAGGTTVKVWDALAGGRLLTSFSHHHKTITSLALASNNQRLLTAGLDRLVKVYDIGTYQVVHTLDYPSPILSLGIAADDSVLAVGMSDGLLSIQHRKKDAPEEVKERKSKKAAYQYKLHATLHQPHQGDEVIQHQRKERLARYDRMLKRFEFTKALDAAMDLRVRLKTPEVVVSVMQELIRRGGLKSALAGRDMKSLTNILKFLQKNISNHKYSRTLVDVANIVIDIYGSQIGQSSALEDLLRRLKDTVDQELNYMSQLLQLMGTMDTLFAAANQGQAPVTGASTVPLPSEAAAADVISTAS